MACRPPFNRLLPQTDGVWQFPALLSRGRAFPTPLRWALGALLLVGLSASGCFLFASGDGTPAPIPITLRATDRVNPDEQGQALATVVRIYQLKGTAKVDAADFDSVYRREKETLGEDLIQVEELEIPPGKSLSKNITPDKATKAVMVMAIFRRPVGNLWRSIVPLAADQHGELSFTLDDYRIDKHP
jgi:type VI secretion system protein VasD